MSRIGEPEQRWSGYQNLAKFFREMNRCGCGRFKSVRAIRCAHCRAPRAERVAASNSAQPGRRRVFRQVRAGSPAAGRAESL